MSIPAVTVHAIIRNEEAKKNAAPREVVQVPYVHTPLPTVKKKHGRRAKPNYLKTNWSKVFRFQWF